MVMVMEAEFGEMSVNQSVEDENEVVYEKPIDIQLDNDDDDDEDDDDDAGVDAVDGITVDQEAEENYDDNEEEEEEDDDEERQFDLTSEQDTESLHGGPGGSTRSETLTPLPLTSLDEKKFQPMAPSEQSIENDNTNEDSSQSLTPTGTSPSPSSSSRPARRGGRRGRSAQSNLGKKVPAHLLEKRRLGRIKAAEEFARKLKKIGIEKIESTTLAQTGSFQSILLINQKNYSSDYLKKDDQIFALRDRRNLRSGNNNSNNTNTNTPTAPKFNVTEDLSNPATTIVIHPGSESIKIGFAQDDRPVIVPNCVAVPVPQQHEAVAVVSTGSNTNLEFTHDELEKFMLLREDLDKSFKERMRYYKRRIQPNSVEQVKSFNETVKPEKVLSQNDPSAVPWRGTTESQSGGGLFYGDEALVCPEPYYRHRHPFSTTSLFNIQSDKSLYRSFQELLGDAINLIQMGLDRLPNYVRGKGRQYKVVLVVSDLFEKSHLETLIGVLLTEFSFHAVAVIQEALANCYGAGLSTATCVVNVGASQTTVACIDEGIVLENSLVTLNYGSNDITRLFILLLALNKFPFKGWQLDTVQGWQLAENLKKDLITYQDADVTVQMASFIKRLPGEDTEKYDFKIFDEVILAPLALFYPRIFKFLQNRESSSSPSSSSSSQNTQLQCQLPKSRDPFTNLITDWRSLTQEDCLASSKKTIDEIQTSPELYCDFNDEFVLMQRLLEVEQLAEKLEDSTLAMEEEFNGMEKNYAPLDKAIVQSITNASLLLDPSKVSSFYSNILVVGGGSKIPSFDFMLTDRINIWRPRLIGLSSFPHFYKTLNAKLKCLQENFVIHKESSSAATGNTEADGLNDVESITSNTQNSEVATQQLERTTPLTSGTKEQLEEEIQRVTKNELANYIRQVETNGNNEHFLPVIVIPPPKEMDPALLAWKGGSVFGQIRLVEELYITTKDWDLHGSRILQYKCLFTY